MASQRTDSEADITAHIKAIHSLITYFPTNSGFTYLSVMQDMCNNEVVAHAISSRNDFALVLATLNKLTAVPGAVVHSDQGFQYTHKLYHNQLEKL